MFNHFALDDVYTRKTSPNCKTEDVYTPARNMNKEIFLHRQEGFRVGKFGRVVDQAVLENRPLRKHFIRSRLR